VGHGYKSFKQLTQTLFPASFNVMGIKQNINVMHHH